MSEKFEQQGPTPGVRLIEVSVKRTFSVSGRKATQRKAGKR